MDESREVDTRGCASGGGCVEKKGVVRGYGGVVFTSFFCETSDDGVLERCFSTREAKF